MADDYKSFYASSDDGPRQNALRAGRAWANATRRKGNLPYRTDRDGDAQMGEGSNMRLSLPDSLPSANQPKRGGIGHVSRSRSISFTGPGVGMRLPGVPGDVFSRLGARPGGSQMPIRTIGQPIRGQADRRRHPHNRASGGGPRWYKIKLMNTAAVEEVWLKKTIQDNLSAPLNVQMTLEGNARVFYMINGPLVAELRALDRKLNLPHGGKISININESQPPPSMQINENVKARIKEVMAGRYDGATESLNLSAFADDREFLKEQWSIAPYRTNVMVAIVELIQNNTPRLRSLDLSKNKLRELGAFSALAGKVPLEKLNLADNTIGRTHELDRLKKFTLLRDLDLSRNPLRDEHRDTPSYVENVRKKLTNLAQLDGVELPRKIGFDTPARVSLPVPVKIYVSNEKLQAPLMAFVQQFFQCYDGPRQELVNAYAEDAQFSFQFLRAPERNAAYTPHIRNLHFLADNAAKIKRLHVGKTAILSLFTSLPQTMHIMESLTMDVLYNENSLVGCNVSGCFREDFEKRTKGTLRAFSRNFVIRDSAEGLSILSDTLTISLVNPEQVKQFNDLGLVKPEEIPSTSAAILPAPMPNVTAIPDAALQAAMVADFASKSGMNERFSRMCLEDNNWNYDLAAAAFTKLKDQNQLPAEAFIK